MLHGYDTARGGSAHRVCTRHKGVRHPVGAHPGLVRRRVSLHGRRDGVQSAAKGEECGDTHDAQYRDRPRLRRASVQARREDCVQPAPQDAARQLAPDIRRFGFCRVLRTGHHDEASGAALRGAIRRAYEHRGGRDETRRNKIGGALVSARLCRLPEQEVHQFINNTYFLGGAVVSLLVQLRQLHPLIIAHTS